MKQWYSVELQSREYRGQYTGHGNPIFVGLNPNILVRDVERMDIGHCLLELDSVLGY